MQQQLAQLHRNVRHRKARECTEKADSNSPGWSDKAYAFLCRYSRSHQSFLIEEVIHAAYGKVPEPEDTRAWGGVTRRAKNAGEIKPTGRFSTFTRNAQPKILWTRGAA